MDKDDPGRALCGLAEHRDQARGHPGAPYTTRALPSDALRTVWFKRQPDDQAPHRLAMRYGMAQQVHFMMSGCKPLRGAGPTAGAWPSRAHICTVYRGAGASSRSWISR